MPPLLGQHCFVLLTLFLAFSASRAMGQYNRYVAALGDGTVVRGDKLTGWHEIGGTVRLDGEVISAPGKPLSWIRDTSLKPWLAALKSKSEAQRGGFVEFVGGDRIVGIVTGGRDGRYRSGLYIPAHLLVKAHMSRRPPPSNPEVARRTKRHVRILPDTVKRIVFKADPPRRYQPGTVIYMGGQRDRFTDIRWGSDSVRLLTGSGVRTVKLEALAEIQMPRIDQWEAYYRDLALLSPDFRTPLVRIETGDGLIATASRTRQTAEPFASESLEHMAAGRLDSYGRQIERLTAAEPLSVQAMEKAQAHYDKAAAGYNEIIRKNQAACDKAIAELKPRLEKQGRESPDEFARRRKELKERYQRDIDRAREKLGAERERLDQAVERRNQEIAALELRKAMYADLPDAHGSPETWDHMIQPAWSLDPLWVDFKTIQMRWMFAALEFPFSRTVPTEAESPAFQVWRTDRNAWGGQLHSGHRMYGWGFGLHAPTELTFAIPAEAATFQSRAGLDSIVGAGGCVRARVYLGSTDSKPAWESPLLIGSDKTVDTGVMRIPVSAKGRNRLILQVDPAVRDCPPHADPLNVRDKFDWLEPRLVFDPERLWERLRRHIGPRSGVWKDWTLEIDKHDAYRWGSFRDPVTGDGPVRFLPVVAPRGRSLKLSRAMTIRDGDRWMVVDADYVDGSRQDPKSITLRIGDEEIAPEKVPIRQYWRRAAPLIFSIEKYRRKEVKVLLTQRPDGKSMYWREIRTSNREPEAYRLVMSLKVMGKKDMQVSRGLGLEMQRQGGKSDRLSAAFEIARKGGMMNYYDHMHSYYHGWPLARGLDGVTIGPGWTGGDKAFLELQNYPGLRYVVVTSDSGVSRKAFDSLYRAKSSGRRRGFRS